jgi:hypothetical protein
MPENLMDSLGYFEQEWKTKDRLRPKQVKYV